MNRKSGAARGLSAQGFTEKQGQYLAFIYAYSGMFRRPPAEADMQRHFRVSPPSVHQMVLTIERAGFIDANPASPEASSYLLPRKICPS
jgi:DNA-binding MarR family transcriptional regulator